MDSFIIFLGGFDCQEKGEEARGAGVPVMPPPPQEKHGGVGILSHFTQKNFRTFIY